MKKTWLKCAALILAAALVSPVALVAQEDKEKDSKVKEKKDVEQIVITRKGDKDEKVVVEINGDKVTINGKSIEEYKNSGGNISVRTNKLKDMEFLARIPSTTGTWNINTDEHMGLFQTETNRAMLGVTTDKHDAGAEINSITKESAAEKMGLKEGDIITKVDDKKISSPEDLSAAIKAHKPGDKVSVSYLRDNKEQKGTTELSSWKSQNFKMDMGNLNWDKVMPRVQSAPRVNMGQTYTYSGNSPRLGLSVQDTDDGKGVKVLQVETESNAAKAGIKKDDLITEVDGKTINSTDEMVKSMKENKEKVSVMFKYLRDGKVQNVEVKMPRKIKTAGF
jgi:serine protease Do